MDDYKLPSMYGKTRLVLLAVDPYLIHAYWEIAPDDLDKAMEKAGQAQGVLRFYKTGKMAKEDESADCFDVEIDLQSHNWYAHLWSAEESYFADLALKRKNGTLIRLVRSQVVHMPRTHPAIPIDQHWMKVEPGERRAEMVPPPPVEHKRPQKAAVSRVEEPADLRNSEILDQKPIPKPVDSEEVVREEIKSVYASHQWALYDNEPRTLIERLSSRRPQAVGAAHEAQARAERERDSAKPQAMHAAGIHDRQGLFVQNRPDIDLSAMAERDLAAGLSSASLQKGRLNGPTDSKK